MSSQQLFCVVCGRDGSKRCGNCKLFRYCSAGCQRWHWSDGGHKKWCASEGSRSKTYVAAVEAANERVLSAVRSQQRSEGACFVCGGKEGDVALLGCACENFAHRACVVSLHSSEKYVQPRCGRCREDYGMESAAGIAARVEAWRALHRSDDARVEVTRDLMMLLSFHKEKAIALVMAEVNLAEAARDLGLEHLDALECVTSWLMARDPMRTREHCEVGSRVLARAINGLRKQQQQTTSVSTMLAQALSSQAACLTVLKRPEDAWSCARESLQLSTDLFGDDSIEAITATVPFLMAADKVKHDTHLLQEAIQVADKALAHSRRRLGPHHEITIRIDTKLRALNATIAQQKSIARGDDNDD